jgi:hypothetical protein
MDFVQFVYTKLLPSTDLCIAACFAVVAQELMDMLQLHAQQDALTHNRNEVRNLKSSCNVNNIRYDVNSRSFVTTAYLIDIIY